jgi:photosystem II stability/assembly factor-like uncharacterized protein
MKVPHILATIGILLALTLSVKFLAPSSTMRSGEEEPDSPDQALAWRRLAWLDEKGLVLPGAYQNAVSQMQAKWNRPQSRMTSSAQWVERGPYNVAGRSRVLLIHPTNPLKMWMGTAGGGIWASVDGGVTWNPVNDRFPSLAISTLVMDPKDSNTMYAGMGEGYYNIDSIQGHGILKSQDGGQTWNLLTNSTGLNNINRITISPTDSRVILAACQFGGIFRSTDAGINWTKVRGGQSGQMVVFHPTDGNKAVSTVYDYNTTTSSWFRRIAYTLDAGATWTDATFPDVIDNFSNRIELAYAASDPNIVFAYCANLGKVYKSTNGGQSFVNVTTNGITVGQGWYDTSIWVDPTNANRIITTGIHTYKSTDGGVNFTQISTGYLLTESPHPDIHFGVADPGYNGTTNRKFYVTTDGGAFYTNNIWTATTATGWSRLTRNARSSQFYGAVGDGAINRLVGGLQDNGTLKIEDGAVNASAVFGGDGGWCAMDPTDPNYVYGEYVYLTIFRSTDGGSNNSSYIYGGISDAFTGNANFISPFVIDDSNPNRMYAGGGQLWRTTNLKAGTPSWTSIKPTIGSPISAIAISPSDPDVVWVGHNNGALYRTENATAVTPTWVEVDNNGTVNPLPGRYITRILVDQTNSQKVYVSFGGFTSDNFKVTTDKGVTWANLNGTGATALPSAPIRAIAQDPTDSNHLFVGTEVGVLSSNDGGTSWNAFASGPGNVSVDELRFMYHSNKLLAATHGRGLWTYGVTALSTLNVPATISSAANISGSVKLDTPASATGETVTLASSDPSLTVPAAVMIPAGQWGATFPITTQSVGTVRNVKITATLGSSKLEANSAIQPPKPVTLVLSSPFIVGSTRNKLTGTVTLDAPAPVGNLSGTVTASIPGLIPTPTFKVLAGQKTAAITVASRAVPATVDATVTVTIGPASKSANVQVRTARVKSLLFSPAAVRGGTSVAVTGTVNIDAPAAPGGAVVTLTSSNPSAATVPSTVTVPEGQTSVQFTLTHFQVSVNTMVDVTASRDSLNFVRTFTVRK